MSRSPARAIRSTPQSIPFSTRCRDAAWAAARSARPGRESGWGGGRQDRGGCRGGCDHRKDHWRRNRCRRWRCRGWCGGGWCSSENREEGCGRPSRRRGQDEAQVEAGFDHLSNTGFGERTAVTNRPRQSGCTHLNWHEERRMTRTMMIALALLAAGACRGGEPKQAAANTDSMSRDLQLAPVDTSKPLADPPAAAPAPAPDPAPPAPAPKPKAKPKPKPAEKPPATPAPAAESAKADAPALGPATLDAGSVIAAAMLDSSNSKSNKAGETVKAKVASDVKDATGRVVIPAGSTITMTITELHESERKSDKTGKLKLTPTSVDIGGKSYPLDAAVDSVQYILKGRGVRAGDIGKGAAGAGTGLSARE